MTVHAGVYGPEPFIDRGGNARPDSVVSVYGTDGSSLATLYADRDRSTGVANPLPTGVASGAAGLDGRGNAVFYADPGMYVIAAVIDGNEVWRGPARVDPDPGDVSTPVTLPIAQTDVTGLTASLSAVAASVTAEETARAAADATESDARVATDGALAAAITAEQTARGNADGDLAASITSEQAARTTADSGLTNAITAEQTARSDADTSLAASIASGDAASTAAAAAAQAFAVQRANHTGTQAGTTVTVNPSGLVVVTTTNVQAAIAELDAAAAAGPVGTVGGHLTGSLPNPSIANGVITNAMIAAGAAIAASKVDLSGVQSSIDRIWLGTGQLEVAFGTGSLATWGPANNKWGGWTMPDATAAEAVGGSLMVPPHWLTYKLSAVFGNSAATAGNVVVQGTHGEAGDGDTAALTGPGNVTVTMPAQNAVKVAQLFTNVAVNAAKIAYVKVTRIGNDALDTYAGSAILVGMLLERVT